LPFVRVRFSIGTNLGDLHRGRTPRFPTDADAEDENEDNKDEDDNEYEHDDEKD
jgi:hypothetical protein